MRIAIYDQAGTQHVYNVTATDRQEALKEAWRLHTGNPSLQELPPYWANAHALLESRHLGTYNRVYGGDPNLVHIVDGTRKNIGKSVANYIDIIMRGQAVKDPTGEALCPGCYMIALYDAAVVLAQNSGQSLSELGHSMAYIFTQLAQGEVNLTEEITVMVDPADPREPVLGLVDTDAILETVNSDIPLVNQPPVDGKNHEEPVNSRIAPLLGLENVT